MTAPFAVILAGPLLLPAIGATLSDVALVIPLLVLTLAAIRCAGAARRVPERRMAWLFLCASNAVVALASSLALANRLAGSGELAGLYMGCAGSVLLLLAGVALVRRSLPGARLEPLVDSVLTLSVIVGAGVYFVAVPGLDRGDSLLTAIFLIDLAALSLALVSTVVRSGKRHRRCGTVLVAGMAVAAAGDALVSHAATGKTPLPIVAVALLWAGAGALFALAADEEDGRPEEPSPEREHGFGGVYMRVLFPLAVVLTFPAIAAILLATGRLGTWETVYFSAFFLGALVLAFGRQAYVLLDNRRAVVRERRLREQVMRRNEELEALTGLATTMTETLEETPIVERGLNVLALAARAQGAALHTGEPDGYHLAAAAGDWQAERHWAGRSELGAKSRSVTTRGRRQIAHLPLAAREEPLGVVTLVRPEEDVFNEDELRLLSLLVDQLAIAIHNARSYREKLEQAVRDPLTGLYNRRYFYEALEKEVRRSERYGSTSSLVLFDIDDFKSINDTFGHACGDQVLCKLGEIVQGLIRPSDSFARIGGEEFALLLPETSQLDALLAAERVRIAVARHQILEGRTVTVSGGVSTCPDDATTRDSLETMADAALYWAKGNGKNLCAVTSEVVLETNADQHNTLVAHFHALAVAMDSQHVHTRDHSENVAAYASALGQALGLGPDRVMKLHRAALFHDLGKIVVREQILAKPGPLDAVEYADMQRHSVAGSTMLLRGGLPEEAAWVRHHHERVDGRGYPDGLCGEDIPLEARIIFVADAFEAMTSDRPYRSGMPIEAALEELRRNAGTQFEMSIVETFLELISEGRVAVLALKV